METIQSIPEARLLLASLRSVGYTEEAAIADIIDNCISAGATTIDVVFDWGNRQISIIDNGFGMTQDALLENMRIGSSDPNKQRDISDLGRFGMGMKTAAFSLGKKLLVVTKNGEKTSNASWDLDAIPQIGWNLIISDDGVVSEIANNINGQQGTAVVIDNLDRIIDPTDLKKSKKRFYSVVSKVEKHLSLVFHRFMTDDGLCITMNGNAVIPWDPFITYNSATQELPDETVWSENGSSEMQIQPYVLPHKTKFSSEEEYQDAGGPKGWTYHQGIYIYRNRRLIVCGSWFDYIKKEPAYNLARIKVDITSDSDDDWKIDIKKSSASIPLYAKEALERAMDICTEASARVYNSRGSYSKNNISSPNLNYVWEQRKKNGRYSFHINKKHSLADYVRNQLDSEGRNAFNAYLSLIEDFAPFMQSGILDSLQGSSASAEMINESEYASEISELKNYISLFYERGFTKEEIKATLLEMSSYRHLHTEIIKLLEEYQ